MSVHGGTMKRVLHVVESLAAGGAERVVVEYALAHDRTRYRPEVCCVIRGGPLREQLDAAGVPVHVLDRRSRFDPRAVLRLRFLLSRGGFDVVHYHNFAALSVGLPAALLSGVRAVVRTEHNVTHGGRGVRWLISRLAALREDAQIGVSKAVTRSHLASRRIPRSRFVTVRNGIDEARLHVAASREDVRRSLGVADDEILCLTVSSLTVQKDHANLLRAASRVARAEPRAVFLVAGEGALKEKLEREAAELGVGKRVRFLGRRLDVPALLKAADLFVLSSAWEGLPITILEAMAAGVPCVVTDVGGVSEVVVDGVTGRVVPPRDSASLAAGILDLTAADDLRREMSLRARSLFERGFTAESMVSQTEALYDMALTGGVRYAVSDRIVALFVIGQLGYGGAERQLLELVSRLPRDKFRPTVCSLSGPGELAGEIEAVGVPVVSFNKKRGILSMCSVELLILVMRLRPAVLQTYLFSANWRGLLAGRDAGVPLIVSSVRNVDIHTRKSMEHLDRSISGMTDRMIANAESVKAYVARNHLVDPNRIQVIYNGVSLDRVESANQASSDGRTVVMIASLTSKKDHATFLEAARLLRDRTPDARFLVVGDGPLRAEIEARAHALGLAEAVEFLGSTDDVGGVLSGADVSVLSSLKEGCSNVILESMAAGKPVVATRVGGNAELVVDGVTGFLVNPGDAEGIASRTEALLGDPAMRARMGAAGHTRVLERFTAERMVEDTVRLYTHELRLRIPGLVEWVEETSRRDPLSVGEVRQ